MRALGALLTLFGLAAILPAPAAAQAPSYLGQWGSPGSGDGQFWYPIGVATDAAGNVYVVDRQTGLGNPRIQKFTNTGTYLMQWGSTGSGDGQFASPTGVATDAAGNVYVADQGNNRIQKFTSTGTYLTQWGSTGSGDGQFSAPVGVATDGAGNVYVTDTGNNRIQKFTNTGTYLTQWGFTGSEWGSGDGQFANPTGVATDAAGNVYVVDFSQNHRIQKFTGAGTYLTQWGSLGSGDGQLSNPFLLAIDSAGNVYVTDFENHRIQKFTGVGAYLTQWGSLGSGDGQFNYPVGVAVDDAGSVYVTDLNNHRVQKFGDIVTPAMSSTWGRVKATYRE